jgi:predicted metal-dependent HD superfamily phosphohydrolase
VERRERFLLMTAALLHDVVYVQGRKDNEEMSAGLALEQLPSFGYHGEELNELYALILATKLPTRPKNRLEMIICDSDLDNLGRDDFFEKGNALREELGLQPGREWYLSQLKFLKSHSYYTISARKFRLEGLARNIQLLEKLTEDERC